MSHTKPKFYLNAVTLYRFYSHPSIRKIPLIPKIMESINYFIFNCSIPASAVIGKGTYFSHRGMAVVIHKNAIIGDDCVIGTCVTLGGRGKGIAGAPVVGNCVVISTGAKVLGDVRIGNFATVGANSVVLKDVPENMTAVGVPAKNI
ncbi:serine O-acetyltransferase [Catenovulum agarivorans]|uniref:serine O-acetyltransferase n=1 Tax=Catenovulum agarivorans TaxID=1172192 RepID=UPI0002FFE661|nr:serine acetyltransferase [Catenovulum agarivorans]